MRRFLAHTLLVLLVLWPGVHLLLSKQLGFSPWRFGGWGMYATPERRQPFVGLTAIVVPADDESMVGLERVGMVAAGGEQLTEVVEARHGVIALGRGFAQQGAALEYLHPVLLAEQGKRLHHVYTFADERSLGELAGLLDDILIGGPEPRVWYIVVSYRRINVDTNETSSEGTVYRVADGEVMRIDGPEPL